MAASHWAVLLVSALALQEAALDDPTIEQGVKFYLLTNDHPTGIPVDFTADSLQSNGFDRSKSTTVIIHGWTRNINAWVIQKIGHGLLEKGYPTNIIGVDWGELAPKSSYSLSRSRVGPVGARVAVFIDFLVNSGLARPEDIHVIGHSLGGHVAGNVGKHTKVARITGLDPAGPLFFEDSIDRISATDANLVDIIHSGIGAEGYKKPLGLVDFYPNGGHNPQPGCEILDVKSLGICSHNRSYEFFAESVVDPDGFPAIKCDSYENAMIKNCHAPDTTKLAYMGYKLRYPEPGVYYLQTRPNPPFSLKLSSTAPVKWG